MDVVSCKIHNKNIAHEWKQIGEMEIFLYLIIYRPNLNMFCIIVE